MCLDIVIFQKPSKQSNVEPREIIPDKLKYIYWGGLALIILLTVFIRIRLLGIPLERDEGEFAYMGQLILQGVPPYLLSYSLKLPGTPAAYALIMSLFGETIAGIHLGLIIINIATIVLVFLIVARLFDRFSGLISACSYAILSLSPTVYGTQAHATHFVMLPALGGVLFMLRFTEHERKGHIFWSGFLLGLAFLMKQHAIFFIIFAFLYLLFNLIRKPGFSYKNLLKVEFLFLMGVAIPFAITCGVLYLTGAFENFWFWNFYLAAQTATRLPFLFGVKNFFIQITRVIGQFYLFWCLAIAGIIILVVDYKYRHRAVFVYGLLIFSLLAICPAFYFNAHYFILLLPVLSLLIGVGVSGLTGYVVLKQTILRSMPVVLFIAIFLFSLFQYRDFFFQMTPFQACRYMYDSNPFIESIEIAKYIESFSDKEDKIAVIGSEPEIFFYAHRHSATAYIVIYDVMRDQKFAVNMQQEMIEELEKEKPKYMIFVCLNTSWFNFGKHPNARSFTKSVANNIDKNYYLVGIFNFFPGDYVESHWGVEASSYLNQSPCFISIHERKANNTFN